MRSRIAVAMVWMGMSAVAAAQSLPVETKTSTLNATSTLVVVPTLVRTKAGEVVYTLKADDFVVTDDGVPQKVMLEEDSGGEPLALVVVIEAGAANRAAGWHPYKPGQAPDRFTGVPAMVEAMTAGVPHRVAVVGFDSMPELELGFTENLDEVGQTIYELSEANAGDKGAAILDSLSFAVDLLRKAPSGYRRAILLLSETVDRGSETTVDDAVRRITETNTAVYGVAFSTAFHQISEYGSKQLPTKAVPLRRPEREEAAPATMSPEELVAYRILQGMLFGLTMHNPNPNPPTGCMGIDPAISPKVAGNFGSRLYDCLAQLAPPLSVMRMAVMAVASETRRNVPKTVARLTGGEYFEFNTATSLERDLAKLANHVPNRYRLSFQPQTPHAGIHLVTVQLKDYPGLTVTARSMYWVDAAPR